MTIFDVLDERGDRFPGTIARAAKRNSLGSDRMMQLKLCKNGMATQTDTVRVYRVDDTAFWYFDEDRMAVSMPVQTVPRALREVLDGTEWCLEQFDQKHLTDDLDADIHSRIEEVTA